MEIKINYKNKLKIINLILGFVWLVLGASKMILDDDFGWISYFYIALGIVYFALFYFQTRRSFVQIKNGVIKVNADFGSQKMLLAEIKSVRKFAGDYLLISENDKLVIHLQMMEEDSIIELNKVLEELDVTWK